MNNKSFDELDFFVGREKELTQLYKIVGEAQNFGTGALINLWGIKGIGKTAFLKQICQKREHTIFGIPVVFVSSYISLANLKTKDEIKENLMASFVTTIKVLHMPEDIIISIEKIIFGENPLEEIILPVASFGPLVFAFDDFHLLENSDPELAQCFLDEIAIPLVRLTKAIVFLSGNYSLGGNPNIVKEQRMKIDKIPSSIKLEGLGLDELRLFLRIQIPSIVNAREDLVDLVFTYTAGHPLLILLALKNIKDSRFIPELWDEIKEETQRIILGDQFNKEIYDLRMQCLPALSQLAIFRTFSAALLEEANITFIGFEGRSAHQVITHFLRANLISYEPVKGGYIIDQTIRQIIENQLFLYNVELWKSSHLEGSNLYYNLLSEYPIQSDAYLLEFLFHSFSLLKINHDFKDIFDNRLDKIKLKVRFDTDSFLQLVLNDPQIQFLVKSTFVKPYFKSLQSWVIKPGKGSQKMAHDIVFVRPNRLIGKTRNDQFSQILAKIMDTQKASILIEGGGGIGKSDILRRLIEAVNNKGIRQSIIVPDKDKGIIDLAFPINRDPIYIMNWIATGISKRLGDTSFQKFKKEYENFKKGSVYSHILLNNETSIGDLLPIWIEEYNEVVDMHKCKIIIAFDTVEKLHEDSLLSKFLRYMLLGDDGIKNTILITAGRLINKSLDLSLKQYDKSYCQVKLETLDYGDTKEYIKEIRNGKSISDKKDEEVYFSLSQGYPVIISLLVSLADVDRTILGNMAQDQEVINALKPIGGESKLSRDALSVIFQKVCSQYVKYIQEQEDDSVRPIDIYNLILEVRRGIDGSLLSYLEDGGRNPEECQDDIANWAERFKPLIKEILNPFMNDEGKNSYVVAHDVIFEHAYPALPMLDRKRILERVVEYYRMRRKDFFNSPNLAEAMPEIYLSVLQDRIYYEFVLNPWYSLRVLSQEIHSAYRQGEALLMTRLWEEWHLLVIDNAAAQMRLEIPSSEFYKIEEDFLHYRVQILKGNLEGIGEKLLSLQSRIDDSIEIQNESANTFFAELRINISVELEKVNILDASFSGYVNFERSLEGIQQIIDSAQDNPSFNKRVLADAYSMRGLYWMQVMRYDKAYQDLIKAFPIYRDLALYTDMSRCQAQLSLLSILQGHYSRAEQHYLLANEYAINLSRDSIVVSLVQRNLAHLYMADGNLQRAGRIYENLFREFNYSQTEKEDSNDDRSEILKDRPGYEQALHWLSFAEIKSCEVFSSLILKDLLSSYSQRQINQVEIYFANANKNINWNNQLSRFDLNYLKSEFYLYYLTSLRLIPDISDEENLQDRLLESAKQGITDFMGSVENDKDRVFGWRLLKYYFIQSLYYFIEGDFYTAKEANENAQRELSRIKNLLLEEKRRTQQPVFDDLGEVFVEFYSLEGRVLLLTGHLLLAGDVDEKLLSVALSKYDLALRHLLHHPNRSYLMFAYEEIRFYLLKLFKDEKTLHTELNKILSEMQAPENAGIQYLRENLQLRSGNLY